MGRPRSSFATLKGLAETATAGVEFFVCQDEPEIARPLQCVAALAWGLVAEPTLEGCASLRGELDAAESALRQVCHADRARGFLRDAGRFLDELESALADAKLVLIPRGGPDAG